MNEAPLGDPSHLLGDTMDSDRVSVTRQLEEGGRNDQVQMKSFKAAEPQVCVVLQWGILYLSKPRKYSAQLLCTSQAGCAVQKGDVNELC